MRKPLHVARPKHETAAELKRIFPEFVLLMARFPRSFSCCGVVASQQMKNIAGFQLRSFVRQPLLINKQGKRYASLFSEFTGVDRISQCDGGEPRSFFANRFFVCAQLCDVFAAKDSAVVPQKNDNRGLLLPQRTKPDFAPVAIRQHDHRKPVTDRVFHASPSCAPPLPLSSRTLRRLRSEVFAISSVWPVCLPPYAWSTIAARPLPNCAHRFLANPKLRRIHVILN